MVAQKVLVQQQHSYVGGVPETYQPYCEELSRDWNLHCGVYVMYQWCWCDCCYFFFLFFLEMIMVWILSERWKEGGVGGGGGIEMGEERILMMWGERRVDWGNGFWLWGRVRRRNARGKNGWCRVRSSVEVKGFGKFCYVSPKTWGDVICYTIIKIIIFLIYAIKESLWEELRKKENCKCVSYFE